MDDPDPFDAGAVARISAAIVKAIAEAKTLVDAGESGPELREVVVHARELHDLLLEQMLAAEPANAEYLRGLCDAIGNNVGALEQLLGIQPRQPPAVH